MTPSAQQARAQPDRRSLQTNATAPDAPLPPSLRHAAGRRAALEHELIVRRWLRDLTRR